MGEKFAWIFDVLVIAIVLFCIYSGMKKGLVKTVLVLVGYLVAAAGGFFISKAVAPVIYNNFLEDKVSGIMEDIIDKINIKSSI